MNMNTILIIWELMMSALIVIALVVTVVTAIVCVIRPQAWNDVMVKPWEKEERREEKRKEKEELRARREFWMQ